VFSFWANAAALGPLDGENVPPPLPGKTWEKVFLQFFAGGFAGACSKTATAPLERLKVMYQLSTDKKPPGIIAALRSIYADGGLRGLYRSNGANILKVMPEMGIKLLSYDKIKSLFGPEDQIALWQRFIAGGLAGSFCHASIYPLDVIKTRLAASNAHYTGIWDCGKKILLQEGPFAFYKGMTPMLLSTIPNNAITLSLYSTLKDEIVRVTDKDAGVFALAGASTVSSLIGQTLSYPFHVIKSRMAMNGAHGHPKTYTGIFDVARKTYAKEGYGGFFKGLTPTLLKHVPGQAVLFVTYETLKKYLHLEARHKHK